MEIIVECDSHSDCLAWTDSLPCVILHPKNIYILFQRSHMKHKVYVNGLQVEEAKRPADTGVSVMLYLASKSDETIS